MNDKDESHCLSIGADQCNSTAKRERAVFFHGPEQLRNEVFFSVEMGNHSNVRFRPTINSLVVDGLQSQ
jgi:hypothetical protein